MNISHKILLTALILSISPGCSYSSNERVSLVSNWKSLCGHAMQGELEIDKHGINDPKFNSYLFNCAIAIIVPLPNESQSSVKKRMNKKLKVADALMEKNIDVEYKDETGTTLLMSVIISHMPRSWKLKTAENLLIKGANIGAKNSYGKTAFDLAKFSEDSKMLSLLNNYQQ
jgi:hypothetical protein